MYPIIVVGHPRSGTSVVARLLQQRLDIMMNPKVILYGEVNPKGYYEDPVLVKINVDMMKRWEKGKGFVNKIDPTWAIQFAQYVTYMSTKYKKWGFKEPRMMGFISWTAQFFKDPTWIYTIRTDKQIIKSQVNKLGVPFDDAVRGVPAYRYCIEQHLKDRRHYRIDLKNQREEDDIVNELKEIMKWQ